MLRCREGIGHAGALRARVVGVMQHLRFERHGPHRRSELQGTVV
jgi:hypothetical protein